MSSPAALHGEMTIRPDPIGVAAAVADRLVELSREAVAERGHFAVALAGGTTPHLLYEALATSAYRSYIDWAAWEIFWGDERAVPPDDDHSNYRLASDALLIKVPVEPSRVHRMEAERADLDAAAAEYSQLLAETLGPEPRLDCVLLGLGENGHTASLFPGTEALEVNDRWAVRGRADYAPFDRITLTYPAINAAREVCFMVTGGSKEEALHATAAGRTPAARVRPQDGVLRWFLDRQAAATLD